MPPLLMTGFDRQHLPTRTLRAAARGSADPLSHRVSTGQLKAWDLLSLKDSSLPGASAWADKTLDAIVASAVARFSGALDCEECTDLGFYGLVSGEDPDVLTALLRREGDGGYEQLTASGTWAPYETRYDQQLEILNRELAGDLAEAITAGASGLARRYFWPKAFLPPETMIAAAPAKELTQPVEKIEAGPEDGWTEYAIVDDLDPGAVLDLIRLRPGPELVVYRNGVWSEAPDLLSDLQGVQPPPLVELDQPQLDAVLEQIGSSAPSAPASADDAGEGGTTAAAGALIADVPLTVSPDPRAEKLRRYWTTGKGAVKIRWGTDGDWTRCVRQLRKHMGASAKGYCQNLHKRATGIWTGSRLNASGSKPLTASGRPARGALSLEAALVASVSTGSWIGPVGTGEVMTLKDGIYAEAGNNVTLLRTLTAGGFPVAPPEDWFEDPQLEGPTPLTVDDDGRVSGHIATFDVAHIGLPGRVHAPKSRSNYAYFKTGQLVTASGKKVNVGQLTLAGGHAPLSADASAAVAHYDNTASAVADLNMGEDRYGVWVAGAVRPEVTPSQLRALRASAPSGDWRPINGQLELVAVCQVNVPGFPTVRAQVASGAITALVAAGAGPLYARKLALLADAAVAERLTALEAHVYGVTDGPDLVETEVAEGVTGDEAQELLADGTAPVEESAEGSVTEETVAAEEPAAEQTPETDEVSAPKTASEAVERARALARERREARMADEEAAEARRAELRARVHGNREPVAAAVEGGSGNS